MHIVKLLTAPNGAQTNIHRVTSLNISSDPNVAPRHATNVSFIVTSFTDTSAETRLSWQETVKMDLEDFVGSTYPTNVFDHLTKEGGYLAGGQVVVELLSEIDELRALLLQRVNLVRDRAIFGGMYFPTIGLFDSDEVSIRNIQGGVLNATIAVQREDSEWVNHWRLADDTMVELTSQQMIDVGLALNTHISQCYALSWQLKAALDAATTIEELSNVNIYEGWPSVEPEPPVEPEPEFPLEPEPPVEPEPPIEPPVEEGAE